MLSAGIVEAVQMIAAGQKSNIIIPVKIEILQLNDIYDLYFTVLRKLEASVRQSLLFEIKGLKPDSFSPSIKEILDELVELGRGIMIDTGILSRPDYADNGLKPHAYGFDITGLKLPDDDVIKLMKKYTEFYAGIGVTTYIKGISSMDILLSAKELGFSSLIGPLVFAAQPSLMPTRAMSFEEIKEAVVKT